MLRKTSSSNKAGRCQIKTIKPIYRLDNLWFRRPRSQQERKFADRDHKFVRPKRNKTNLPDDCDTQIIKRQKSWKHHSKTKKQWK